MSDLVFLEPNKIDAVPFTTSDVIAERAEIKHHAVQVLIQKYESDLKEFGRVSFEMRALPTKGGIQEFKIYHLNEEQATLLLTYLKNTVPVRAFKKELVKQFYLMRAELQKRQIAKFDRKPIRRELTDVIQDDPNHSKWDYKLYTDLAYKTVLGKNAAQIRKERGAGKKAVASDYMTSEEISAVAKLESQISALKELGMDYQQIKMLLLNRQVIGNIAS
jgi:phage regulator Rha-like protein